MFLSVFQQSDGFCGLKLLVLVWLLVVLFLEHQCTFGKMSMAELIFIKY